jgi:oligopeptide/dipeptide ABC transporter ATP-binding protein
LSKQLLRVENLRTYFDTYLGELKAVNGVSFEINENEIFGLVGESGCGKTVTALSILRLINYPGKIVDGKIFFKNEDLLEKNESEMQQIRGQGISMIFQDPCSSLNPVLKIGNQISEVFKFHKNYSSEKSKEESVKIMKLVGIPAPKIRFRNYPHQFSGGMRQRIMTAISLSCAPSLLIADEPTTSLDVTIQAQILNLIHKLSRSMKVSVLMITHNLGLIARYADRVGVMYAGKLVELADVDTVFYNPLHPYTKGLLKSIPKIGHKGKLNVIKGVVPSLIGNFTKCRFFSRCLNRKKICEKGEPSFKEVEPGHKVSCHLYSTEDL